MPSIPLNLTLFDYLLFTLIVACIVYLYDQQIRLRKLLPYKSSSKKTKILSVVAGENLDMTEIEKSLYSTDITYNLLPYSSVSQDSFLSELSKDITVLDISSHGLNGAFRLGNTTIPINWLAQALLVNNTVECVLLLYCKSYLDISAISTLGKCVVGLVDEVTDSSCVVFSRQFYFYLNKHYTYKEAFEVARLSLPVADFPKFIFSEGEKIEKTKHY